MLLGSPKSNNTDVATFLKTQISSPKNLLSLNFDFNNKSGIFSSRLSRFAYQFSDYHLAYRARLCMMIKIANYEGYLNQKSKSLDCDTFGQLTQKRCQQILYSLLKPKIQQEFAYCNQFLQKLHIYDNNSDKILTYNEYVSFFMEVCLPALSLSNLQQTSSARLKGIINKQQFINALTIQLQLIKCKVTEKQLDILFNEILRQNNQEYLTVDKYYQFMKGYLGRQGIAAKHDMLSQLKNKYYHQIQDQKTYERILERITKIIFRQLHSKILDYDRQQKLGLSKYQIQNFIEQNFQQIKRIKQQETQKQPYNYEQCLKIVIRQVFTNNKFSINLKKDQQKQIAMQSFIDIIIKKYLNWMKIKPSKYLLQEIYQYYVNKNGVFGPKQIQRFLKDLGLAYQPKQQF